MRPRSGDQVMVYFDVGAVPLNDVAIATTVTADRVVLQRAHSLRESDFAIHTPVTVLFTTGGRLYHWPMRLDEVLPSSFFLSSVREPGEGERREFVRAHVPMRGRIEDHAGAKWTDVGAVEDLSAAGFCVPSSLSLPVGEIVAVELLPVAESSHENALKGREINEIEPIRGVARVVRASPKTAFEFIELASAAENRVSDLVFGAREEALLARLRSTTQSES